MFTLYVSAESESMSALVRCLRTYRHTNDATATDPFSLKFKDTALEQAFRIEIAKSNASSIQICLVVLSIFVIVFLIFDYSSYPEAASILLIMRPCITASLLLLAFGFRWTNKHRPDLCPRLYMFTMTWMAAVDEAVRLVQELRHGNFSPATILPFQVPSFFHPIST